MPCEALAAGGDAARQTPRPTPHASGSQASARALDNYLAKSTASINRINSYREIYGEILKGLDQQLEQKE